MHVTKRILNRAAKLYLRRWYLWGAYSVALKLALVGASFEGAQAFGIAGLVVLVGLTLTEATLETVFGR